MPSTYGRSVAAALFAFFLTVFQFAHADTTPTAAQLLLQALTPPTPYIPYVNPTVGSTTSTGTPQPSAGITNPFLLASLPSLAPLNANLVPEEAIVPDASSAPTSTSRTTTVSPDLFKTLYAEVAALEAQIAAIEATSSAPSCAPPTLTRSLDLGSTGSDVSALQQFLESKGYYTYPSITGYFGPASEKAVAAFQGANGISPVGSVGRITRAKIASIRTSCSSQPKGTTNTQSSATSSQATLPFGVTLNYPGYGGGGGGGGTSSGGGGSSPTPDTTPPMISSIASSPNGTTATITWTTDEAANSQVVYGTTASYGSATTSSTLTTSHSIGITGLATSTTYHYAVVSTDSFGNTSTSSDESFTTYSANVAVVKNIVTDFGATCNGSGSDESAFNAFNTWALNWQQSNSGLIELVIPSGSVCMFPSVIAEEWTVGIKQLLVVGYGATLSSSNTSDPGFWLGGKGVIDDINHSARVATVSAGSSCVIALTPSQTSRFTTGTYALISGLDLQGYGYAPNWHFFEYVKIASINAGTGVVCFDAPLKNTYESTWPSYDFAGSGGPAALWVLDPSWDAEFEYRGLTIDQVYQTYSVGRSVTYRDVTFTGSSCAIPTQNLAWTLINVMMPNCDVEADKLVSTVSVENSTIHQIDFQSSSIDLLNMSNSNVTIMHGTPQQAVISNSTVDTFGPGAYAYGRSDEVTCTNVSVRPSTSAISSSRMICSLFDWQIKVCT